MKTVSDRQCMVDDLSMQFIVEHFFRIHLRHIKHFHDDKLLSFSAKLTFKIMNLDGYVFLIQ